MTTRLVILTEIIAPYRIPVFNALARNPEVDLHVIFLAETDSALRQWRVYKNEIRFPHRVLPSWRWHLGKGSFLVNRGLRSALNTIRPQVIICGGYNYAASWQALLWARRHAVRFVLWSESNNHDARASRPWTESLKAYFLRHCDRFVVPGRASHEYLRSLGNSETRISTAPNAVDSEYFAARADELRNCASAFREKLKLPPRFILFVGRLVPEKGVLDLLNAYAKLDATVRSEVSLVFAGDGLMREELQKRAEHIRPGTICFPGFTQREDLAGLYALADALILPTHSDTWGLVVNEAMSTGLPIVVTSVAGCSSDLVDDGWNGFIVPPRDPEKLSAAITSLLLQPELRQQMRLRSRQRIEGYSPQACAEGLAASAISAASGVL